ncbi:MAG: hypothetical protein ISS43_03310 [Candidatus Omnitrophica bacterium]|nr:hypothetical protein [Candidatus Omnitrophota bacterium]
MDKKIKVLLICLGIVSLSAAGIAAWIYLSAQAEVATSAKKQAELEKQSAYLQEKVDSSQKELRHWSAKSEAIKTSLTKLGKEHTLLQSQYDSLLKQKDSLAQQNEKLDQKLERLEKFYVQAQEKMRLSASDKFLASLLEEKAAKEVEAQKLKDRLDSQKAHIEDVEKNARPSKEKMERLEKEIKALEKRWQDAQKVSNVLSNDLLKEKKTKTTLTEELARAEEQLKSIIQERDKLSDQLVKMKMALERRLVELNQTREVLEGAVEGAKEVAKKTEMPSIQLPPIVVKAEEEAPLALPAVPERLIRARIATEEETVTLFGNIITVNDKHKFVVIDIGRDHGVEKAMIFDVYRKNEKIGRVEVIETRKNIAACDIKEMTARRLKVNDTVRR